MYVHSFPPIAHAGARILILGTMPGKVSLRERQYYAHPQNVFWRIAGEVFCFDAKAAYRARASALAASGVALWDVLKSCTRASSLDSDIVGSSIVPNDIAGFLLRHPRIRRICFNGAKAEALFLRNVHPLLQQHAEIEYLRLPSTSPAHASIPFSKKLRAWRRIVAT
ncbi:MAG TPA: DNA-deoxyinosine glycosylase [Burkholderiales bacterium]|nr:DNA-deoxyinosine glycosylase [Burkholderiales bacterium]